MGRVLVHTQIGFLKNAKNLVFYFVITSSASISTLDLKNSMVVKLNHIETFPGNFMRFG